MRLPRVRLILCACTLAAVSASAQVPAGYHLGAAIVLPDTLVEVFAGGRFRATIHRAARTPRERDLIALAERLYPQPESLLAVARDSAERVNLTGMASGQPHRYYRDVPRVAGAPADRWWFDDFDATWMPFAVTGATVDYYIGRLRDIAAGRGQFVYGPTEKPDWGTFVYEATVRPSSDAGSAYIVELKIDWEYWCSDMCGVGFTHTRSVWFDARGNVVRVTGDGRPYVVVS